MGRVFYICRSAPRAALRRIEVALILYHCDIAHGHREDELKDRFDRCGFRTEVSNRTTHRVLLIATRADGARGEASRW